MTCLKKSWLIIIGILILFLNCKQGNTSKKASQWISLFNGKDLTGWQVKCLPEDKVKTYWFVEDSAITCNSMQDPDHNYVWLITEEEFSDFDLKIQFKAFKDSPGNSGVAGIMKVRMRPMAAG